MLYHEYPPPPELKNYIQCFWRLEHDYREKFHSHEHLWADTNIELIFSYGRPYYRKIKSKRQNLPGSFVIGPFKKELLLYSDGLTGFIAVRFHPWGFSPFSKKKMIGLIDKVIPVGDVMDKSAAILGKGLTAGTVAEKLATITAYFVNEQRKLGNNKIDTLPIAEEIKAKKGMVKITDLVKKFNISPRRLERCFVREIGMPAKMFSRIRRFNYAKHLIEGNPDISLSNLTYETGYADQAHFSRNFKEMFNYTPAEFKLLIRRFKENSGNHKMDVVFLQDK